MYRSDHSDTISVRFQAAGFKILFEIYKNFCYNIFRKVEDKKTVLQVIEFILIPIMTIIIILSTTIGIAVIIKASNFLEYFIYLFS